MSCGAAAALAVRADSSQWPLTTTMARGGAGRVAGRPSRKRFVAFQVSVGPHVQSIKKQGPPPWGRKMAGWRSLLAVMSKFSGHPAKAV